MAEKREKLKNKMAEKKGHYFPDFLIIISTSCSTMTLELTHLHRPLASTLRGKGYYYLF